MIAMAITNRRRHGEETTMLPQVADRGLRAAAAADQQVTAQGNHADNRHHLDDGKPELGFTEDFDVGQVDRVDQHEERRRRDPGRNLRPPVVHVLADGRQLRHTHQNVQNPAVPARQEAGETAPVLVGKVAERAGNRLLDNHFAKLAHDHEGDKAADGIAQDHRRAGGFEHPGRAQEQAGADSATEGDQLDMPVFQAAFQLA